LVACSPSILLVSKGIEGLITRRPPLLAKWVHPPVNFTSPTEFSGPHPPGVSRPRAPSWGFPPLRDINQWRPHSQASHSLLCSVLGVSHPLDGLLRLWPCRFISPCCHVRDSLFRGCCLRCSHTISSMTCALLPFLPHSLSPTCADNATNMARDFRALLHTGVRCARTRD